MKKLLVLALVLSMASLASAGLQISVGGEKQPGVVELMPSDTITLDIWTDAAIAPGVGEVPAWFLVADVQGAAIAGGSILFPTEPGIALYDDAINTGGFPGPANGVWGAVLITGIISGIAADATIYDGITFHCEAPGDVLVSLVWTADYENFLVMDSVMIHQAIPEPMTIGLLGLGGLFLRRRSK